MSNAFSLRCIHPSCKVLYFILPDDDFEIKSKIYSFNLRLVLKHILHSQNVFFRHNWVHGIFFLRHNDYAPITPGAAQETRSEKVSNNI